MASASGFKSSLKSFHTNVVAIAQNYALSIARQIQLSAAFKTPIETGAAKDSWNLSSPAPNPDFKDRRGTGQGPGGAYGYWNPTGPPIAEQTVAGYTLGQPLHVSNNVPYAKILNDRVHMAETAVAEVVAGVIK